MKPIFLLFLLCLSVLAGRGQNLPEQNCIDGIPVCQSGYNQTNTYIGAGTIVELNATNQGCLGAGEKNCVWYIIQVSTTGLLSLNITPNILTNDYDFAVWDISANGCQDIYNGTPPIGCNFSGASGITGLTSVIPLPGPQFSPSIAVTAGQTLALNVSNYSESQQSGYILDFTTSTASIYDTLPPRFATTYVPCGYTADSVDVKMTESVKCSSIEADGSNFFVVSGAPGTVVPPGVTAIFARGLNCSSPTSLTRIIRVKFSSILPPGTYQLRSKLGNSGTTIQDPCSNSISTGIKPDSIDFKMIASLTPAIASLEGPACINTRIVFNKKVRCNTVAPDGSDFVISGPSPVNIVRVVKKACDTLGTVDSMTLYFEDRVALPGTYTLSFKTGTDGNGIIDTCGATAVAPFNFSVSDEGITATVTPSVLCAPGYVELTSVPLNKPSNIIPVCGTATGAYTGTNTLNVIIGTDTTITNGTLRYTPFNGTNRNARTQMLYKATDLLASGLVAGRINQLSLDIATKKSTLPYSGFTLKMSCTPLESLTGGYVAGLSVVYGPVAYTTTAGINNFNLNTNYEWDGKQNIIVELCYSNASSSDYDQVRYTSSVNTANTVLHRFQNGTVAGCSFTNATTTSGGISSALPNIRFQATTPPQAGYFLHWFPGTGVFDSTAANTRAYVAKDKDFIVQIIDTFQCFRRSTVRVIIPPRFPEANPNNDTSICFGGAASLMTSGGQTYNWFPTTGLSCTDCPNPNASPNVTTTYFVSIADQYGCADTLTNTVVVNPLPVVRASDDIVINWGSSTQLYVLSPGANYFLWTPINGLDNANSPMPKASPLETTEYRVEVIDSNYCISYDTVIVFVNKNVKMFVPSAFTPNGDGTNDRFQVINLAFHKLIEMRVFNRWGQQVCTTTDNRQGWDGTIDGTPQPAGVYQYIIRVALADGNVQIFKGDVTLLR